LWARWRNGRRPAGRAPCFYVVEERFKAEGKARKRRDFSPRFSKARARKFVLPHERTLASPKRTPQAAERRRGQRQPIFGIFPDPAAPCAARSKGPPRPKPSRRGA